MVDECFDPQLAIEMLHWVISKNGGNRYTKKAFSIIAERYLNEYGIADMFDTETESEFLETVITKSNDLSARAVASYLLALKKTDEDNRETVLLEILKNHSDVVYRGKKLESYLLAPLTELRFRIGKVAPDIAGPDTEEVDFKLSNYRGKVVLLSFWGDW